MLSKGEQMGWRAWGQWRLTMMMMGVENDKASTRGIWQK
uniref:Uncharacterized protein n=1 Tax=Rhizophora mucronata TaxID=61149 RepID=A0A2P2IPB1_RHIMU